MMQVEPTTDNQHLTSKLLSFAKQQVMQAIPDTLHPLPFVCGIIGYCSYRFGEIIHNIQDSPSCYPLDRPLQTFPDAFIAYYTWSYVYDHHSQKGWLTFSPLCPQTLRDEIKHLISSTNRQSVAYHHTDLIWKKTQSYLSYQTAFDKAKSYIFAGDCYQVNLTQRFECNLNEDQQRFDAIQYYLYQHARLQTPYSAFIKFSPDQHLLSFSPEQFIRICNRIIESKPIKGTIANTDNSADIEQLKNSKKNQAENVMIVDLLRNDLSKVSEVNSVHVPELFKIESFQNVHHLVSHICGTLRHDICELEAFLACFPGGSITGAPKKRAMEIIKEIELSERSAYCGSVFYRNDNGDFNSNILIRSIVHQENMLYCWAGGGIVADSEVDEEYAESLTKVANLTGIND